MDSFSLRTKMKAVKEVKEGELIKREDIFASRWGGMGRPWVAIC